MTNLYFDCQAGISGDMTVGALLNLGVPLEHLKSELAKLHLNPDSYQLSIERTERHHISAWLFDVKVNDHQTHRHYSDIDAMIRNSNLSNLVKERSQTIFKTLAGAEAKVHGVPLHDVHFHEVGCIDSIIDIVGTAICLEYLGVEKIYASSLPLCSGFINSDHGRLPLPAPATAELLKGIQLHNRCGVGERVTPTGAAIVASLVDFSSPWQNMNFTKIGYGAGKSDFDDSPNILRAFLCNEETQKCELVVEVSCNLDDVTPEVIGYTAEKLLEQGALDVWFTPIIMKKGRPATLLSFLCKPEKVEALAKSVMLETGTLGVRHQMLERMIQERKVEERKTRYGSIRFKITPTGIKPEYEDCRRIARDLNIPCRIVMGNCRKDMEMELL